MRGANDILLLVVVGRVGVLVEVEAGEAPGALDQFGIRRVGQAQQVEVDVALGLVELVVTELIFFVDVAQARHLARDRVPLLQPKRQQLICAAEQVQQREVIEALIEVVGAIAALELLAPDQLVLALAIWISVLVQVGMDSRR